MKISTFTVLVLFCAIFSSASFASSSSVADKFVQCLSTTNSNAPMPIIYTPKKSSYTSALKTLVRNRRFSTPKTPKPELIVRPLNESHVPPVVICARKYGLHLITRSGGHDYEGQSYVSDIPFVLLDLINLASVDVDADDGTAWVQSGATVGQLYYTIGEKSRNYTFPAGTGHTVGIGGHLSGGGHGTLLRKYGVAADNIVDARIVTADGKILNRKSMGEDFFWAIRGGGGASLGVILSWKIQLVPVPSMVTVFRVTRSLEQGATALVQKWQYIADKLPEELFIRIFIDAANSSQNGKGRTIQTSFQSLYLGKREQLIRILDNRFPELGVKRNDCIELIYIQAVLYFAEFPTDSPVNVLQGKTSSEKFFKAKSDYVMKPIPESGLIGLWKLILEEIGPEVIFTPYGGIMSEIPESSIPFPHRKGNIFNIQSLAYWEEGATTQHLEWIRRLYAYLTPYVSKSPRAAYINYIDLDLGRSKNGTASYAQAKSWGEMYFKNNFDRLVKVKSMVDPDNFFRNEQSIPVRGKKN